jgi:hypothetical protein
VGYICHQRDPTKGDKRNFTELPGESGSCNVEEYKTEKKKRTYCRDAKE